MAIDAFVGHYLHDVNCFLWLINEVLCIYALIVDSYALIIDNACYNHWLP